MPGWPDPITLISAQSQSEAAKCPRGHDAFETQEPCATAHQGTKVTSVALSSGRDERPLGATEGPAGQGYPELRARTSDEHDRKQPTRSAGSDGSADTGPRG